MASQYSGDLSQLLVDDAAVAVVSKQRLRPVDGVGAPFFPPTYLGSNDRPTYCISPLGEGQNLCVVDSVQSQANRIEAAFLREPYRNLVRRVEVTARLANSETRTLDMLELGHRLADAAVTFSTLAAEAQSAMRAFATSAEEIAKISPMSLLCGMWESRGEKSQLKIPRALASTITARNVRELRRMATYSGSFWSKDLGLDEKHAEEGLDPVPAGEALGGVVADGEILRTTTLNLVALRQNCKATLPQPPGPVANYIYALGLVAMTLPLETFLRQGCLLVNDGAADTVVIYRNGQEALLVADHDEVLALAQRAAEAFGVPSLAPLIGDFQADKVVAKKGKAEKKKPE